jgi:hypothetical protein
MQSCLLKLDPVNPLPIKLDSLDPVAILKQSLLYFVDTVKLITLSSTTVGRKLWQLFYAIFANFDTPKKIADQKSNFFIVTCTDLQSLKWICHPLFEKGQRLNCFSFNFLTLAWPVQSVHFLCPQWHELRPQRSQEDIPYHFKIGRPCPF